MAGSIFILFFSLSCNEGVEKMKKVKVTERYNDIVLDKVQVPGTVLEVEDNRARHLVSEGKAEYVPKLEKSTRKG